MQASKQPLQPPTSFGAGEEAVGAAAEGGVDEGSVTEGGVTEGGTTGVAPTEALALALAEACRLRQAKDGR